MRRQTTKRDSNVGFAMISRYSLQEEIGRGSFATVYRAADEVTGLRLTCCFLGFGDLLLDAVGCLLWLFFDVSAGIAGSGDFMLQIAQLSLLIDFPRTAHCLLVKRLRVENSTRNYRPIWSLKSKFYPKRDIHISLDCLI